MKNLIVLISLLFALSGVAQTTTADNCLQGQDVNAESIDISSCPELPNYPDSATYAGTGERVTLGSWELEKAANGDTYVIGSQGRFDDPKYGVDDKNRDCWAKGYYRLRQLLQNPPPAYTKLREAGFQRSFFQFQVDLRIGQTGYTRGNLRAYRDHLVKWVTQVDQNGNCKFPTYDRFEDFAQQQLRNRGL